MHNSAGSSPQAQPQVFTNSQELAIDQTPPSAINRRSALAAMGAMGVLGAVGGSALGANPAKRGNPMHNALGWNSTKAEYELAPLPYAYDALEPHIDAQTMEIHHSKHHAGYVSGLNNAISKLAAARDNQDAATIQHWQRQLSFHAGGHINHALFWTGMAPAGQGGGGEAGGSLRQAIERDFGSYQAFVWQFKQAAASVEASGWAWLVYEPMGGRLLISQMENQQKLLVTGATPLLGIDVWEHAYYLKYQNRRAAYIDAFFNVINWSAIQSRFDASLQTGTGNAREHAID
jgi:superoxide dismutase, Fe-Mn family